MSGDKAARVQLGDAMSTLSHPYFLSAGQDAELLKEHRFSEYMAQEVGVEGMGLETHRAVVRFFSTLPRVEELNVEPTHIIVGSTAYQHGIFAIWSIAGEYRQFEVDEFAVHLAWRGKPLSDPRFGVATTLTRLQVVPVPGVTGRMIRQRYPKSLTFFQWEALPSMP